MIVQSEDILHYGILRKSGRYPWGSGKTSLARSRTFIETISAMEKEGMKPTEICRAFDIKDKDGNITESFSTTQLRAAKSIARNEVKRADQIQAQRLRDHGNSNVEIGRIMGKNESSIRALLAEGAKDKADVLTNVSNMLKERVDSKGFIDVGAGVELHVGVSDTTFKNAVAVLKEQGYNTHTIQIEQLGTGQQTNLKVLTPPGVTKSDVYKNKDKIQQVNSFSEDGGRTLLGIKPPMSISPNRVSVRYAEQGGKEADGVMFVRPGVKDVSLGGASYAQVRVQVGDGHYLKGMAMYKNDLPDGVDIVFNTNKSDTGHKLDALKPLKRTKDGAIDTENPFGANIQRQLIERDSRGKEKLTSVMNIVNEEGNWSQWSKTLSSQMLSKQTPALVREQLGKTYEQRVKEFERISALTNPEVRKKLLIAFGDEADSAAVHLKAAAIPGTHGHHVILPISSMKPGEIYAPNYKHGDRVVLVRHPHGGPFEIPELVVNNKHQEARRVIGVHAKDAVGIHHSVAERLSGADFDGDTVLVIPNNRNKVRKAPPLEQLKNFDPHGTYKKYDGMAVMKKSAVGTHMGQITNLITDMSIQGASNDELARAVRHSMVIIDAHKHELNYKQSAKDHGIAALKQKYQGKATGGAATLLSRAGSEIRIPQVAPRRASEGGPIDKKTGARIFKETGNSYINKNGKLVVKQSTFEKLALATDAHSLSSGTPIERVYADHSNKLKALANKARKDGINTGTFKYNPSAKKVYSREVAELNSALALARRNAPLERQAQLLGGIFYKMRLDDDPNMVPEEKKKIRSQALTAARARTGAGKEKIVITDSQWDAIQAGAISPSKLQDILSNADMDRVRELATPRQQRLMTATKTARAKALLARDYTQAEVAAQLGVSLTTLKEAIE